MNQGPLPDTWRREAVGPYTAKTLRTFYPRWRPRLADVELRADIIAQLTDPTVLEGTGVE